MAAAKPLSPIIPAVLLAASLAAPARTAAAPKDFDQFWGKVKKELAAVPLESKLEPDPAHTDANVACYKVSYLSLGRIRIHARYCRPMGAGPFPAALISPWYAQGAIPPPVDPPKRGIAALWYQARGFDVDQSSYPIENSWYVLSGIEDPKTFVYRGMVAHALRGLEFLASRPEVDAKRLAVMGASQGGGLSLLAAALDRRVAAAAADFPFLSDWEGSMARAQPPYAEVKKYISDRPDRRESVLKTLRYFDALNAAPRITAPVLINVGLKDRTCPPEGVKKVFAAVASPDKTLKEYPTADHTDQGPVRWQAIVDFLTRKLTVR